MSRQRRNEYRDLAFQAACCFAASLTFDEVEGDALPVPPPSFSGAEALKKSAKLQALVRIVQSAGARGAGAESKSGEEDGPVKFVVFSQWRQLLVHARMALQHSGVQCTILDRRSDAASLLMRAAQSSG